MPVLLSTSHRTPPADAYAQWCALGKTDCRLPPDRKRPGLAREVETAADAIRDEWIALARKLGQASLTAELGHAATCNTNVSDLGAQMAWTRLIDAWDRRDETILVVCDDPWLYRHLAQRGIRATATAPRLSGPATRLAVRGFLARIRFAVRALLAMVRTRGDIGRCPAGASALISYGHPASTAAGRDAYFGDLMTWNSGLIRLMHVDCPVARAAELAAGGRSFSLHGWAHPLAALALPFARWRPGAPARTGPDRWLVRRAAALANGTAQPAAIAWQIHCQTRWLRDRRPSVVLWPWENHGWERALVRAARAGAVATVGYQHTVVGRRHWVHALSNADGAASVPDRVACSGPVWIDVLTSYGIPRDRLEVGGALRFSPPKPLPHDPAGPVYVALPFAHDIARQIDAAIRPLARSGRWRFIVSSHPMNPYPLTPEPGIAAAPGPLSATDGVAAVLYAATTVGLEALIGGLPVVRFIPEDNASVDVIPDTIAVPTATAEDVAGALDAAIAAPPPAPDAEAFFRRPHRDDWARLIGDAH